LHQVGDLFELNVKLRCQKVFFLHHARRLDGPPKIRLHRCWNFQ